MDRETIVKKIEEQKELLKTQRALVKEVKNDLSALESLLGMLDAGLL